MAAMAAAAATTDVEAAVDLAMEKLNHQVPVPVAELRSLWLDWVKEYSDAVPTPPAIATAEVKAGITDAPEKDDMLTSLQKALDAARTDYRKDGLTLEVYRKVRRLESGEEFPSASTKAPAYDRWRRPLFKEAARRFRASLEWKAAARAAHKPSCDALEPAFAAWLDHVEDYRRHAADLASFAREILPTE